MTRTGRSKRSGGSSRSGQSGRSRQSGRYDRTDEGGLPDLTRRGQVVLGVVILGVFSSWLFGARSLNAVVVPAAVVLGAAVLQLYRIDRPTVEWTDPAPGFPGETRTVTLDVREGGTVAARIDAAHPEGVHATLPIDVTVGDGPISYEIELRERGVHHLGSTHLYLQDVFGLSEREFTYSSPGTAVVYPEVYELAGASYDSELISEREMIRDRQEFDRLREYEPGDVLRDIHWASSAKRPPGELVVKEFVAPDGDENEDAIDIVAVSHPDWADEVASAAASVACFLLNRNVEVSLETRDGVIDPGVGESQRIAILTHLARFEGGSPPNERLERADVVAYAYENGEVGVRQGSREEPFSAFRGANLQTANAARADGGERS